MVMKVRKRKKLKTVVTRRKRKQRPASVPSTNRADVSSFKRGIQVYHHLNECTILLTRHADAPYFEPVYHPLNQTCKPVYHTLNQATRCIIL